MPLQAVNGRIKRPNAQFSFSRFIGRPQAAAGAKVKEESQYPLCHGGHNQVIRYVRKWRGASACAA